MCLLRGNTLIHTVRLARPRPRPGRATPLWELRESFLVSALHWVFPSSLFWRGRLNGSELRDLDDRSSLAAGSCTVEGLCGTRAADVLVFVKLLEPLDLFLKNVVSSNQKYQLPHVRRFVVF
eukprot:7137027-Prymnesium_polylepis.1